MDWRAKSWGARSAIFLCAAAWVAAASGCGTSVYGQKFQQRLDQLEYSSQFSPLRDPTTDLAINFRVPQLFIKEYTSISADPENESHRISITRFAPPGLPDFPGLERKFEVQVSIPNVGGQTQIALWIGEGPTASIRGKFPYSQWANRLKQTGYEVTHPWEDISAPTPDHGTLNWKRLEAQRKTDDGTAIFQMWIYETPKQIAVLGWMTDKRIWEDSKIGELAKVTAGTATISASAAAEPVPVKKK